jgi:crotonobetainyl-CoA:carnitine CoA-transferase CaiB-like acyl-CoA transferase
MLDAIDAPHLAEDPRFRDNEARMAHLAELEAELSVLFRTKPAADWLLALDAKGVPCGPVHDMVQALSDPQTIAREMVVEVDHPTLGAVKTLGLPVKFSQTPGKVRAAAPLYGEHTREILTAYGFGADEIDALTEEGAIRAHT